MRGSSNASARLMSHMTARHPFGCRNKSGMTAEMNKKNRRDFTPPIFLRNFKPVFTRTNATQLGSLEKQEKEPEYQVVDLFAKPAS